MASWKLKLKGKTLPKGPISVNIDAGSKMSDDGLSPQQGSSKPKRAFVPKNSNRRPKQ